MSAPPILFVHLGPEIPSYMKDTVQQARAWNPSAEIVCIAEQRHQFDASETWILLSEIPDTNQYARFKETTILDDYFRNGFWRYTTERLFVIDSWMKWRGIDECFHLENDNTLYFNLEEILPQLRKKSRGILAPIHGGAKENYFRICFAVLYISSREALANMTFTLAASPSHIDEMQRCGEYWLMNPDECWFLPSAPPKTVLEREHYRSGLIDPEYGMIFDAMLYGQYMGGIDPRNEHPGGGVGFVNRDAEFMADQFLYGWKCDDAGRRYPVIMDHDGREWRLANVHVHCKRIADFMS